MSAACPDIDALLVDPCPSHALSHVRECAACRAVLRAVRARPQRRRGTGARFDRRESALPVAAVDATDTALLESEGCARVEALIARIVDSDSPGVLDRNAQRELSLHLAVCGSCHELVGRMTSAKYALVDVPNPETPVPSAHRQSARTHAGSEPLKPASVTPVKTSWLGRLTPPRSHRAVWIGQVTAAAVMAALVVHFLETHATQAPSDIAAIPDPGSGDASREAAAVHVGARKVEGVPTPKTSTTAPTPQTPTVSPVVVPSSPHGAVPPSVMPTSPAVPPLIPQPQPQPQPQPPAPRGPSLPQIVIPPFPTTQSIFAPPVIPVPPSPSPRTATGPGFMTVVCSPFCDGVHVDGQDWGLTPIIRHPVSAGSHALTVSKDGVVKRLNVRVTPDDTTMIRVDMKKTPELEF